MPPSIYHNFDLLITRSGDDYRAFVVDAPGGDADVTFALPFTADELDFLGDLAGARRGGSGAGAGADGPVPDLKELGSLLHGAVVQGKVAAVLSTSLDRAEEERAGLRVRLRFSEETSELATLPWEILYDPVQARFLALSESSPILRYLSLPRARPTLLVEPPLRLLAILVSPPGYEELNLEREWEVLESSLAGLAESGKFVVERLAVSSLAALQDRLLGEDVHILHFVGHGVFDGQTGEGALLFADETGEAHPVSGEALAQRLHNHRSLRLVYLNACQGALASHLTVFSGVAQTLVQQGVPAAVAMQAEITDEAAIQLSRTFYAALAGGRPVDAALTQARVAVAERSTEWAIPVLFSRSPDNRLFDVVEILPAPDCPYPGMVPFTEKQANVFFGRDKEISDAIERLRQHPFLTVIGPSGSGKSSLVYAGVIPELRKTKRFGAGEWDVRTMRPSDTRTSDGKAAPMTALRAVLQLPDNAVNATPQSLNLQSPHLLFIDQFEETFTLADAGEAQSFLDALNRLIDQPNLYIILTVRADFYPELMACSLWQPIRANRLELTPLGDEELRAAILQPAAQVGVTIDEVLAERLVADAAGESGALPLVQEALVLLWEKVERRHLALAAYTAMAEGNRNGLQVAIDRRATTVYNNLPEAAQPLARRIFLRLVQFGEGRLDTRRQQTVDELRAGGDDTQVFDETLAKLTANRLLTTSGEEGSIRRVDIAHEALIGGWGLLRQWLGEKRDAENTRRRLEEKAAEWKRLEHSGGLLDARELADAQDWISNPESLGLGISAELNTLIADSRRALRRADLIRYGSLAVIVGLVVVALAVFAIFQGQLIAEQKDNATAQAAAAAEIAEKATAEAAALVAANAAAATAQWNAQLAATSEANAAEQAELAREQKEEAEHNAREATANKYAAQAQSHLIRNDTTSAVARALDGVLATMLVDGYVVPDADAALRRAVGLYAFRSTLPYFRHVAGLNRVALSPDGALVASVGDDKGVRLWELATRHHLHFFGDLAGSAETVAFSPDGRYLVAAGQDPQIHIWALSSYAEINALEGHSGPVRSLAFSADGTRMASGGEDGAVLLWQTSDWTTLHRLEGHNGTVLDVAFSPEGGRVVSAASDGVLRLWNSNAAELHWAIPVSGGPLHAVVFDPKGEWVAAGGDDTQVTLWDAKSGSPIAALNGHERAVFGLAVNRNGSLLASAGSDSSLRLWNVGNRSVERAFQGAERDRRAFISVIFSADGRALISGGDDRTVRIWDITSGVEIASFPGHVDAVLATAFSPDSREIATVGLDQQIRFWNATSGSTDHLIQTTLGGLNSVAYSPDGRRVAVAGESGLIQVWDRATSTQVLTLTGHVEAVTGVAFRYDNRRIASGSRDGSLRIWDATSGSLEIEIEMGSKVQAIAFEPAGDRLVSAGEDGVIRLLDSEIGQLLGEMTVPEGTVDTLAFSGDGALLAGAGSDKIVRIWNVGSLTPLRIFQGHTDRVRAVAFSLDGKRMASGGDDRTVRLWDVERGEAISVLYGHSDIVRGLAFSLNGDVLVSTSGGTTGNNSVRTWAVNPLEDRFKLEPHGNTVRWAAISPDGRWLATACDDGQVRVWDGENGALLRVINAHGIRVRTVAFSHDSSRLVSAGDDHMVRVWEVSSGEKLVEMAGHGAWVRSAFFSPDDSTIVSASEDRSVRLWNVRTGEELRQMTGHEGVVVFANFSPDGKWIASGAFDRTVRVWSATTGELLRTLPSPSHFNNIVAFSPDGAVLAVGTGDADNVHQVNFWRTDNWEEASTPLIHKGPVRGIAFNPDGQQLLSAGHGNPVQLWDWRQGRLLRTFTEHNKSVWSVNFSADGRFFITGSEDATARLWLADIEELIGLAKALLARDPPIFTPETRSHLINYGK